MKECVCKFCKNRSEFEDRVIKGYEPKGKTPWAYVPREPATFGHAVVVAGEPYLDICDQTMPEGEERFVPKHLQEMMKMIRELALKMRSLEYNGKKCEKVYVITECETPDLHLHFHLIPRFEGERKGHVFLFEKELEEARWMLGNDTNENKIRDAYYSLGVVKGMLDFHKNLIRSNKWTRLNADRVRLIEDIRERLKKGV